MRPDYPRGFPHRGALGQKRTDREHIQMPYIEGADGVVRRADDGFFMDIEACVHNASKPSEPFEFLDDAIVRGIVFVAH